MSEVRTISFPREMGEFIDQKMLQPSKIFQRAVRSLMNGEENKEFYMTRVALLSEKLNLAMKFIEKEGLTDVFFEWEAAKSRGNKQIKNKNR